MAGQWVPDSEREASIRLMVAAKCHSGAANVSFGMRGYVAVRGKQGNNIINLSKTWEKVKLAAQICAAVDDPKDILAISANQLGQRAVHKFGQQVGATSINQRFTPGLFTNHSIKGKFAEPRVIIVCNPNDDKQAVHEAAYAGIPCIALCDVDAHIEYVDCVIPCNTKVKHSVGLIMWMLAREVLKLKGKIHGTEWGVLPDLFFYQDESDQQAIRDQLEGQGEEMAGQAIPPAAQYGVPGADQWGTTAGAWDA